MIDIADLEKDDVGRWVQYQRSNRERGRIKDWNDKYIFVDYKCAGEWERFQDYTGVATEPKDLIFTKLGAEASVSDLAKNSPEGASDVQ